MNKSIKAIIEGLLFIYGDDGISLLDLQNVLEQERPSKIQEVILELQESYESSQDCAFSIQKFGKNKYRLQTKPELHEYFAKLEIAKNNSKLSQSSIEVLSIITYKGPISKNEIEEIRESDCSYQLQKLKSKKLIRAVSKTPTGANLYIITDNFYKLFNIQGGFEQLPQVQFLDSNSNIENNNAKVNDLNAFEDSDDQFEKEFNDEISNDGEEL